MWISFSACSKVLDLRKLIEPWGISSVWGSSLVYHFWIFVLISLNAITNDLWNLHS